ncbi:NUDIX hydrolase [Brevibacterium spongiae]|uniref:NUDIX domain-containing protein n=1 Tax=Brevibacterium spongiae TaxID=2909672 RepID=A0ABY5SST3_9MICO|nr:NUDIX domain-containing protein [Brevibacterium spongiae]UVI37613.1 NUDIX domain-containing protein [Brevibacterium spongiae]
MIDLETARGEVFQAPSGPFSADFVDLFGRLGANSLRRDGGPHHVTASCLVVDPDTESVLLNHHRKAGLWGQFGGHLEPEDESVRAAARREAEEESGLQPLSVSPAPIDLHVHDLSSAFGSCTRHFDVVFAAYASVKAVPSVSSESLDVAWFSLQDLPAALMPDLPARLPGLYSAALRALSARR